MLSGRQHRDHLRYSVGEHVENDTHSSIEAGKPSGSRRRCEHGHGKVGAGQPAVRREQRSAPLVGDRHDDAVEDPNTPSQFVGAPGRYESHLLRKAAASSRASGRGCSVRTPPRTSLVTADNTSTSWCAGAIGGSSGWSSTQGLVTRSAATSIGADASRTFTSRAHHEPHPSALRSRSPCGHAPCCRPPCAGPRPPRFG